MKSRNRQLRQSPAELLFAAGPGTENKDFDFPDSVFTGREKGKSGRNYSSNFYQSGGKRTEGTTGKTAWFQTECKSHAYRNISFSLSGFFEKQGKEFFIADPSALSETAREICKEYGLSITPSQFLNKVSVQKTGAFFNEEPELWEELLEVYQKRLKEENCCDFDDLLLETLKAFREIHSPGNRKKTAL